MCSYVKPIVFVLIFCLVNNPMILISVSCHHLTGVGNYTVRIVCCD